MGAQAEGARSARASDLACLCLIVEHSITFCLHVDHNVKHVNAARITAGTFVANKATQTALSFAEGNKHVYQCKSTLVMHDSGMLPHKP
jgi:hypothetical protein